MIAFSYYLLKVIICSGVLFLYYHLALRNKLFHQWNRFYLLISVFISLVAPLVQVSIMHQVSDEPNKAIQMLQVFQSADGYLEEVTIRGGHGISVSQWMMMVYTTVSIALLLFVLFSLRKIFAIIRSHTIQWIEKIKFVNTNAPGTPFTFFNFIFWNDEIDIKTETGQQIFQHELVHVKEKHTLDKVIMQIILIFFWCNPFFWLIRRELQLIHEFIADKKAVGEHGAAALAAMILNSSYPTQFNSLTNQFFQTSIKRRLAMLAKIQNVKINYISRVLALPIIAITVFAFTLRTKVVEVPFAKLDKPFTVVIDAGHGIMENGKESGVTVDGISEGDIVLAIANKIKELNSNDKLKIVLTRSTDKIVDLHKRVDIAKENNADLFISIHVNASSSDENPNLSSPQSTNKGFEIYVSGKQPSHQTQSETIGAIVREELNSVYPTNPYLLKRKVGVWALDQNVCPSVLVECGFLTDEKDKAFITKEANQTAVAQKILAAVNRFALNQETTSETRIDTVPQKQVREVTIKEEKHPAQDESKKSMFQINTSNPPLFFVDGKEITNAELGKIEPSTIESIDVFKDESATKKYGKKGANGVVEIHLKSKADIKVKEVTLESVNVDTIPRSNTVFTKVEVEAAAKQEEWIQFLQKNLQPFIVDAAAKGAKPGTYTVNVKFIVSKEGALSNFTALNDPGYGLATKVVNMMKDAPKWNPALQNGKAVNSYHTQPITFVIAEQ